MPDSEHSKGDPLNALLQVANQPEEPMEMKMFANPHLSLNQETMQISNAAQSDSELHTDDFEILANNLALRKIPFPIMAMNIFNYLSSVTVNPYRPCWPWSSMSRSNKTEFRQLHNKNGSMYCLHSIVEKYTKSKQVNFLKYLKSNA